jgi:selenocysteine lyase/cysteine desulfurase
MLSDTVIRAMRATELPALERETFLDYATFGPIPRRHAAAAAEVHERHVSAGPTLGQGAALLDALRREAATLLHTDVRRLALLRSTAEGLELVARGLDWHRGDEVVLYERDFVGTLAPFLRLRERGVRVRWIPDRGGRFDVADVEALLGPRTRAVCVSVVDRATGTRAPVGELVALSHERRVWLALDAAQALGVLDLDTDAIGADVIVAQSYKHLVSGFGLALARCSARAIDELEPPLVGWGNTELAPDGTLSLVPSGEARRFEPTMPSLPLLAGVRASLALLNELDPVDREARALGLAAAIRAALLERGYAPAGSERPEEASTLVAVRHPRLEAERLAAALGAERVRCAAVDGALRLSTHAFTTEADVDALLEVLPRAERSAGG